MGHGKPASAQMSAFVPLAHLIEGEGSLVQRIDKASLLCYKHNMLAMLLPAVVAGNREVRTALRMPARMRGDEDDPGCVGIAWFLWAGVVASLVGGCASSGQVRTQADDHYRLAQSYLSNESHLMAEQEIRKALTLRPDDARYFECLALINQMQVYQPQGELNLTRLQLSSQPYTA